MNNHLSEDQFSKCIAGRPAKVELQHIAECSECSAELERFGNTLSLFRGAIRDRIDDRVALYPSGLSPRRPAHAGILKWRWALVVAAAVVLVLVPFLRSEKKPQAVIAEQSSETDPDAVMRAVELHLSRTVPAPMEPIMALIPNDESKAQTGGLQ